MLLSRLRSAIADFIAPSVRSSPMWDAARPIKRLPEWGSNSASPNVYYDNPVWLRGRAENEFRNNGWARRAVRRIVVSAIGASGVNPQFRDKAIQEAWDAWALDCDALGKHDWAGIENQILETTVVSGECFVVLRIENDSLRVQALPPEFLDLARNGGNVFNGIEYEGLRPSAYYLYRQTPGSVSTSLQSVRVPASLCLHIYRPIKATAQRGQSWLAPALIPLRELNEYLEAGLVKQKVAALFTGIVRSAEGTNPLSSSSADSPSLEPGAMVRLPNTGDDISFSDPPDVGSEFDPHVKTQLRRIAAAMQIPYEVLSGDLSSVTFASGRAARIDWRTEIEDIQFNLMVVQFCRPVLNLWLTLRGIEPTKVRWIAPELPMLDARAETMDKLLRARAGFTSRSEIVATSGERIEDIDAEIAADNRRADQLGLVLDSDPRRVTQQGQGQQQTGGADSASQQ